jgi:hypothetical protein
MNTGVLHVQNGSSGTNGWIIAYVGYSRSAEDCAAHSLVVVGKANG